jgi:hypothetical protein
MFERSSALLLLPSEGAVNGGGLWPLYFVLCTLYFVDGDLWMCMQTGHGEQSTKYQVLSTSP